MTHSCRGPISLLKRGAIFFLALSTTLPLASSRALGAEETPPGPPKWAEGLATKDDLAGLIEAVIPTVVRQNLMPPVTDTVAVAITPPSAVAVMVTAPAIRAREVAIEALALPLSSAHHYCNCLEFSQNFQEFALTLFADSAFISWSRTAGPRHTTPPPTPVPRPPPAQSSRQIADT